MHHRSQLGFTLIELMIALVIMGIIAAIALPSYNNQVVRSRRSDCMGVLLGLAQAMEKHNAINYTYLGAASGGGNTGTPANTLYPSTCPTEGDAHYNLTIQAATATTFTVQATPVAGSTQVADGGLRVNSLGQRFWDENADGDYGGANENNWTQD
ncbi:MAG: type IV pilin protein [Halieaceae bacterium]|jgi:type IV pilus assembly protein PilE|nr:type IV pilin protein [Halieaceae bacterium]